MQFQVIHCPSVRHHALNPLRVSSEIVNKTGRSVTFGENQRFEIHQAVLQDLAVLIAAGWIIESPPSQSN